MLDGNTGARPDEGRLPGDTKWILPPSASKLAIEINVAVAAPLHYRCKPSTQSICRRDCALRQRHSRSMPLNSHRDIPGPSSVLGYRSVLVLSRGEAMRRRSKAGGEPAKAQRRKTGARKSRIARKAADPSSSSATREETKVARLTRERDEALQQQRATADENARLHNELRESLRQKTTLRMC